MRAGVRPSIDAYPMDFLKKLGSGLVEEATEKLQTTLTEGASDAMSSLTGSVTKSLLGKAAGTLKPRSRAAFSQPSACHIFLVRSGAAENVMESLSPQIDEAFNGARDNAKQELGAKLVGHAEKVVPAEKVVLIPASTLAHHTLSPTGYGVSLVIAPRESE